MIMNWKFWESKTTTPVEKQEPVTKAYLEKKIQELQYQREVLIQEQLALHKLMDDME